MIYAKIAKNCRRAWLRRRFDNVLKYRSFLGGEDNSPLMSLHELQEKKVKTPINDNILTILLIKLPTSEKRHDFPEITGVVCGDYFCEKVP